MPKDFKYKNLRGQSFRGQDLVNADFSGADLRGVNFTNAILAGATFKQVLSGLTYSRTIFLGFGLLLLSFLSACILVLVGTFVALGIQTKDPIVNYQVLTVTVIWLIIFLLLTIYRGLGKALGASAIAIGATLATILPIFIGLSDKCRDAIQNAIEIILASLAIAFVNVGVTIVAVTGATAIMLAGNFGQGIVGMMAVLTTTLALLVGSKNPFSTNNVFASSIAFGVTITLITLSYYIGWRAIAGDKKYAIIRSIAITICSLGGTSFRGANLSDADFTSATLKHTDLRGAILTRTCWFQAKYLTEARTEGTYLENEPIRKLVVTKTGVDQSFNQMDLRGLNLQGANLVDASFIGAKLSESTLREADLSRANLVQAQFYYADLTAVCLTGAIIQNWSISTDTKLEAVKCEYIYMQLPTKTDPDPCRKPDNRNEVFQEGDFADFIAPIIKTLDLYHTQNVDLRILGHTFKTLDLYHHNGIDPSAVAIALKHLAEKYPEAGLELIALEGRGEEKMRLQARVTGTADRSQLSQEYFMQYQEISSLPYPDLQSLLAGIAEKDERIHSLEQMVMSAITGDKFYVETYYNLGETMSEQHSISINSGGGNVSGVMSGQIADVSGVLNLGAIGGDVSNTIDQLSSVSEPDKPSLKELLAQLQKAIEAEPNLSSEDKAEALEQLKTLAEAGKNPHDSTLQRAAKTALKILKGTISGLSEVAELVPQCAKLLPAIASLLSLS
ncbi:pentapeptide repeat-containing protein [Nostoc sp. FACHB-110]|uniref:pentapeptide repeat-containing protein n=1 Tax=Nostoc sp. FACHB-110 TaxID=2692834 RepID=UPI00168952D8|nr:pentapeptide repeat-containing protein [Nostoc sp. FACHB-110]MBD2438768.1 pentapeptide repeat-containing protein [Nostoc sp. FACHB-110]